MRNPRRIYGGDLLTCVLLLLVAKIIGLALIDQDREPQPRAGDTPLVQATKADTGASQDADQVVMAEVATDDPQRIEEWSQADGSE